MIKIGSLFSGIGGFELGLERAIPGAKTIWQVEQNAFCQKVLKKHWPDAKIYNDVRNITKDNVEPIDILCGGFPCQDISLAGKGKGLHGEKSGLWWEMLRIISELRPSIVVLENVAAVLIRGGCEVIGSLTEIGYCTEWTVISARDFGAPHLRRRWFAVAYSDERREANSIRARRKKSSLCASRDSDSQRFKKQFFCKSKQKIKQYIQVNSKDTQKTYWQRYAPKSPLCRVDDGIPSRVDRLKALGNAIVPQCSEWVGHQIVKSGLLEDML
tara:strand:+ start:9037 stop:9849 length:813 start_codon:yes stop_codon:yes gene_type:complete